MHSIPYMQQILQAYGVPKEIFIPIMMRYKNMKAMVGSLDGTTDFFDIVDGVFQIWC